MFDKFGCFISFFTFVHLFLDFIAIKYQILIAAVVAFLNIFCVPKTLTFSFVNSWITIFTVIQAIHQERNATAFQDAVVGIIFLLAYIIPFFEAFACEQFFINIGGHAVFDFLIGVLTVIDPLMFALQGTKKEDLQQKEAVNDRCIGDSYSILEACEQVFIKFGGHTILDSAIGMLTVIEPCLFALQRMERRSRQRKEAVPVNDCGGKESVNDIPSIFTYNLLSRNFDIQLLNKGAGQTKL